MNNRIDAIYARQSVDKKDSISIESQIDFCKYELKGGNCREYTDKGYSGKNTDRPRFQELVRDIENGMIARVVVYKLDRISRSIIDFANMMELFQKYNVEFISSTEKFDTSTPMGRAMLNICIVFAQLEFFSPFCTYVFYGWLLNKLLMVPTSSNPPCCLGSPVKT